MEERKTILNDEKYLRQISKIVDFSDKSYLEDLKKLKTYCIKNHALALAAVQIGMPKRIIYIRNTDVNKILNNEIDESIILINPQILEEKGNTQFWEACVSCLDNMCLVTRPYKLKVLYYDENEKEHIDIFKDFKATVLCHENDHLNGILHMDISEEIKVMSKEKRLEFRKENGYKILSKSNKYIKNVKK